jgi:hypothetical protein
MALRKERFDNPPERGKTMENDQQSAQQDRVPVEISRGLYRRIKAVAIRKHITISKYLEQLLDEIVPEIDEVVTPGHPPTQESIQKLREFREQLFRENNYQYFGDSVEEIRQMREERLRQLMGEDYDNE